MPMSIETHRRFNIYTTISTLFGGSAIVLSLKEIFFIHWLSSPGLDKLLTVTAFAALAGVARYAFYKWVPGACLKCGGRAFLKTSTELYRFVCRDCGVESVCRPVKPLKVM